ncbi:hypothetical protein EUTSA_v10025850mg [Eutrema salsugineum]|uniref:AT hook motif-containing protein n=1 Tax=Eutrema salsugineum TaxID=72664 RepID=V4MIJ6_EUTSA|nr:uncharacterized protein LOC18028944 [Eutrema salsugineum]ESQ55172.1 hypothetical protein EUTSA_v10025850mg [Eutrema salsugineum]
MNPLNLASTSAPPPPVANDLLAKRKRGRPRKEESSTQQENPQVTPKLDINLVGQMVSGVVEGSFDAGYILNVKVKDSDTKLRGLVFKPGKVTPVTPENDVAPRVKMFSREEIKNQNGHDHQSLPPNDQPMKDAVAGVKISEPAPALSLKPQESNGEASGVQAKEAMIEKDGVTEKQEAATTRLVEFFPTPETVTLTPAQPINLVLAQKETTEQQKPPGETRGFDLMAEEPVCPGEKVPEELQLELGNKTKILNGDSNKMETDPKSSVSKSGFIANLFEGEDKKVDCDMVEEDATPSVK